MTKLLWIQKLNFIKTVFTFYMFPLPAAPPFHEATGEIKIYFLSKRRRSIIKRNLFKKWFKKCNAVKVSKSKNAKTIKLCFFNENQKKEKKSINESLITQPTKIYSSQSKTKKEKMGGFSGTIYLMELQIVIKKTTGLI